MATELRYPKGYVFFDNNGDPLASGTVEYFEAGTTTNEPIYSDAAGSTALPNPITLNSAGRAVDGSNNLVAIYLSDAGATDYKEVVKDSAGTTIWTDDNIPEPVDPADSLSDTAKPRIQWSTDTDAAVSLTSGQLGGGRLADSSSNNITYTPISASTAGNGNGYLIKKTNASNTVTFDPDGSETVDGASTFAWTEDDRAYWFISDGANWQVSLAYLANPADASDTASGPIEIAVQSEMETATDTTRAVVPGRQHLHPGHPKFWAMATVSGGTPTLQTSYNVTSITDTDTGLLTVTIATDFSSANWCCSLTVEHNNNASAVASSIDNGGLAAGTVLLSSYDTGASANANLEDPTSWHVIGFGDQ